MNNKQALEQFSEIFKDMDMESFGKFTMTFFGQAGGSDLLKRNAAFTTGASQAAAVRAVDDFTTGQVKLDQLPTYTGMLGLVSGMALGVYLLAHALGVQDEILEGSSQDPKEVEKKIREAKEAAEKEADEKMFGGIGTDGMSVN